MPCKICLSATREIKDREKRVFYYCDYCKYISLSPDFYLTVEQEKERYLKHNNSFLNSDYVSYIKSIVDNELSIFLASGKNILDFGCGKDPVAAKILTDMRCNVEIYDKIFYPDNSFLSKKYDVIILIEVLEHIAEPMKTLFELSKILKEDGIIFIKTLFHPSDDKLFYNWWYKEDKTHISFFTVETIKIVAEKLNLSLIKHNDKNSVILSK